MNVTPNSFSDGGEFFSTDAIARRLQFLSQFDAIDIGAESTAPQNSSLSWQAEWDRWQMVLPLLKDLTVTISADTYHPETIFELIKYWQDHKLKSKLIWNDISGKFDDSVRDYLKTGRDYIFCHNLAPSRELSGKHMDYTVPKIDLEDYFCRHIHPQVIFDPCLGFSKTYEQNWDIIDKFGEIQNLIKHNRWLIGFSRKSFLKKKYNVVNIDELDRLHIKELDKILKEASDNIWVRSHRPELMFPVN